MGVGRNVRASLVAQLVKNLPAMQEAPVRFLGWEDPLEEGMATHTSILAWRIPMDRGAWWATVRGLQRVGHNWETKHENWETKHVIALKCCVSFCCEK